MLLLTGHVFVAFLASLVAAHPAESNDDHHAHLFKRSDSDGSIPATRCNATDGPERPTTLFAELYGGSKEKYELDMKVVFAREDRDLDGKITVAEAHDYLMRSLVAANRNSTISLGNLVPFADGDGDKKVDWKEFKANMDNLTSTTVVGCEGQCMRFHEKLELCAFFTAPAVDSNLQSIARFQSVTCRLGSPTFQPVGECVDKSECGELQKCFLTDYSSTYGSAVAVSAPPNANGTNVSTDVDVVAHEREKAIKNENRLVSFLIAVAYIVMGFLGSLILFPAAVLWTMVIADTAILALAVAATIVSSIKSNTVSVLGPGKSA